MPLQEEDKSQMILAVCVLMKVPPFLQDAKNSNLILKPFALNANQAEGFPLTAVSLVQIAMHGTLLTQMYAQVAELDSKSTTKMNALKTSTVYSAVVAPLPTILPLALIAIMSKLPMRIMMKLPISVSVIPQNK